MFSTTLFVNSHDRYYNVSASVRFFPLFIKFILSAPTNRDAPLPELRPQVSTCNFQSLEVLAKSYGMELHLTILGNGASLRGSHTSLYGTQDDSYNQDGSHHQPPEAMMVFTLQTIGIQRMLTDQ